MDFKINQMQQINTDMGTKNTNEVTDGTFKFTLASQIEEADLHRVYGIVKLVNESLDQLASELIKDEKDHLAILERVDEIRGMLLDILT